jgi:hypothetical protein|eukprot:16789-Pelagococcus_subviridis.AAC.1
MRDGAPAVVAQLAAADGSGREGRVGDVGRAVLVRHVRGKCGAGATRRDALLLPVVVVARDDDIHSTIDDE